MIRTSNGLVEQIKDEVRAPLYLTIILDIDFSIKWMYIVYFHIAIEKKSCKFLGKCGVSRILFHRYPDIFYKFS